MTSKLNEVSILSKWYGIIPKSVMQDDRLSIEAKAIYAYLISLTGDGDASCMSASEISKQLKISVDKFEESERELIDCGYIKVTFEWAR